MDCTAFSDICYKLVCGCSVQMMLMTTLLPTVAADVAADVSATCRDRFGVVDVVSFRQRSCALCFFYLFPGVGGLKPASGNYTHLVRLNGSDVLETYWVDAEDLASLDRVCKSVSK